MIIKVVAVEEWVVEFKVGAFEKRKDVEEKVDGEFGLVGHEFIAKEEGEHELTVESIGGSGKLEVVLKDGIEDDFIELGLRIVIVVDIGKLFETVVVDKRVKNETQEGSVVVEIKLVDLVENGKMDVIKVKLEDAERFVMGKKVFPMGKGGSAECNRTDDEGEEGGVESESGKEMDKKRVIGIVEFIRLHGEEGKSGS